MESDATYPNHHVVPRAIRAFAGLFALALLLLGTSQEVLAQQTRVLESHQNLEQAAEEAKVRYTQNPTARNLSIMNRAVDSFQQFEQANRKAIQQARLRVRPLETQGEGGPDAFGYTYIDSNEPGGPAYSFIDADAAGVLVTQGDDCSSTGGVFRCTTNPAPGPVPLGTAPFNFYGTDYFSMTPTTNGYMNTNPAETGNKFGNACPFPFGVAPDGGFFAVMWDDLVSGGVTGDPIGGVYWDYFGSCPHPHSSGGCDVFQWKNTNHFGDGPPPAFVFDFEAILFENGDIIYQYDAGNPELGASSTEGIQSAGATTGLLYAEPFCNTFGSLEDNLAVLFKYPDLSTADLAVTKTVNVADPEIGDSVLFTVTLSNLQGGAAVVRVNDLLPGGLTYLSSTTSQGTYNPDNGDWQVGTVGTAPSSATLSIWAGVDIPGSIRNTAFIAFSSLPDPDPDNNSDFADINPVAADLALSKQVTDFDNVDGLISVEFLVRVINQGPNDVCGVEVTDTLSPDMTLVAVSASQGVVTALPPVIGWGVGCLDVGKIASLTVRVTVPEGGNLINTAEVTGSDLPDPDSEPGDGEGDDFSLATAAPRRAADFVPEGGPGGIINRGDRFTADLSAEKTVDVSSAPIGGEVHYTVKITNQGPQSTAKVEVTDHLPDCLTDVTWTADRGEYDGWIWDIGKIKVGEMVTLEVWATVGPNCSGTVTNKAEVTASSLPDPDDQFNLFDDPPVQDGVSEASFDVEARADGRYLDGTVFALGNNYPNPFNPATVVPFSLPEASHVSIRVYDLLGRSVATLVDGQMHAGVHEVRFDASHLPTGMYMVRMVVAGKVYTQRMTLMK